MTDDQAAAGGSLFVATQFVEPALAPGQRFEGTKETNLGSFVSETEAIAVARAAWLEFQKRDTRDVAWWLVKADGEELARWIADSRSPVERVLDLTTNELVELRP
jgi:hypothetical protein